MSEPPSEKPAHVSVAPSESGSGDDERRTGRDGSRISKIAHVSAWSSALAARPECVMTTRVPPMPTSETRGEAMQSTARWAPVCE